MTCRAKAYADLAVQTNPVTSVPGGGSWIARSGRSEAIAGGIRPIATLEVARGDCLARMNRIAEAERAFNDEIRLFPHDEQAYASLTALYILQGRMNDAHKAAERLVLANPYRRAYNLAAQTFQELGRPEEAAAWRKRGASVQE